MKYWALSSQKSWSYHIFCIGLARFSLFIIVAKHFVSLQFRDLYAAPIQGTHSEKWCDSDVNTWIMWLLWFQLSAPREYSHLLVDMTVTRPLKYSAGHNKHINERRVAKLYLTLNACTKTLSHGMEKTHGVTRTSDGRPHPWRKVHHGNLRGQIKINKSGEQNLLMFMSKLLTYKLNSNIFLEVILRTIVKKLGRAEEKKIIRGGRLCHGCRGDAPGVCHVLSNCGIFGHFECFFLGHISYYRVTLKRVKNISDTGLFADESYTRFAATNCNLYRPSN